MMGSLNLDEYSSSANGSYYSSRNSRRYYVNENLVVDYNSRHHRQAAPLSNPAPAAVAAAATGYHHHQPPERGPTTPGYNYAPSKPSPAAREESWQQREQLHQQARATRSAPVLITRVEATPSHAGLGQPSRRGYSDGGGRLWSAPNATGSRSVTPLSAEYTDSRVRHHVTSGALNQMKRERPAGRHASPVGSILKLAPRHDRVGVVEVASLSSWIDDKTPSEAAQPPPTRPATTPAGSRGFFRGRSVDSDTSRAADLPPRQWRSRALSSSPTRHYQGERDFVSSTGTGSGSSKPVATTPRNQRRVLFKNNVAVYRFNSDRDGAGTDVDGTGSHGSSMSASSELLNGEPRRHHHQHHHHQGNRNQQQQQQQQQRQQRVGSGGVRPQNSDLDDVRRLPPREAHSGRPRVMPIWNGPTFGAQLVGSSLRKPVGVPPVDRCHSPGGATGGGEPQASLWVDDVGSSCQMQSIGQSATIARVRYVEVEDLGGHRLIITCFLRSGSYWDSDDIVVKANRAGSRVRIVFGGAGMACPSDQLILPVTVDPYRLVARLQPNTRLVIEAPVINR